MTQPAAAPPEKLRALPVLLDEEPLFPEFAPLPFPLLDDIPLLDAIADLPGTCSGGGAV